MCIFVKFVYLLLAISFCFLFLSSRNKSVFIYDFPTNYGFIEESLPKNLELCLPARERKGRSRNSWVREVADGVKEKRTEKMEWIEREEWRRKIKI